MLPQKIAFSFPILLAFSIMVLQPLNAQDSPPATTTTVAEKNVPRREGNPREGGRGQGGVGARADETPEQRKERMERMLQPYIDILPDLTEDQKTHILVILEASSSEVRALRSNQTLSTERKAEQLKRVRGFLPERICIALTETQEVTYKAAMAEQAEVMAQMDKVGSVRPDEDVEQKRARVLQGYDTVFEELTIKQKTAIIKILETSGEESAAISADTKLSTEQKQTALRKVHDNISAKVLPLLDAEQKATWNKVHGGKRP
jgi:hypothetical protein